MENLKISAYAISYAGLESKINRDNVYINGKFITDEERASKYTYNEVNQNNIQIYAVCDGTGEGQFGAIPPKAVTQLLKLLQQRLNKEENRGKEKGMIQEFISDTNKKILLYKESVEKDYVGTTFSGIFLFGNKAFTVNLGDSRVYVYDENNGLKQITQDHTEARSLVELGILKREQADVHRANSKITRYFGLDEDEIELLADTSDVFDVEEGDYIIITSDGVTDLMENTELEAIIKSEDIDEKTIAKNILERVQNSKDDVSLIVAQVLDAEAEEKKGFLGRKKGLLGRENKFRVIRNEPKVSKSFDEDTSSNKQNNDNNDYDDRDYDDNDYDNDDYNESRLDIKKLAPIFVSVVLIVVIMLTCFSLFGKGSDPKKQNPIATNESDKKASESVEDKEQGEMIVVDESKGQDNVETDNEENVDNNSTDGDQIDFNFGDDDQSSNSSANSSGNSNYNSEYKSYTIQKGDTLFGISKSHYGKNVIAQIKQYNKLTSDNIFPGQTLKLPNNIDSVKLQEKPVAENNAETKPATEQQAETPKENLDKNEYEIKSGDTLYGISKRFYGTPSKVKDIEQLNGFNEQSVLKVGDIIKLP